MIPLWSIPYVFASWKETLFQATYSENQFSWHSLRPWSQVLAASFFPHSLHRDQGLASQKAGRPTYRALLFLLLSSLALCIQLFSTAESSLQVTLGAGRLRREESLAECVLSREGLSWGRTLLCVRAAPAPQPRSELASLWYSDKGQLFHS